MFKVVKTEKIKHSIYKKTKQTDEFVKVKHRGKIYTPDYLVKIILDRGGYRGPDILKKHVIDNSCGNGQFMIQVVERYCQEFLKKSKDIDVLKSELETYIHAIELDGKELKRCVERCNKMAKAHGATDIQWDFINANTLDVDKFDGKMDFVVGNPPYVRIHNLDEVSSSVKSYKFCKNGMTDLYILFCELGIKMLNSKGTLAYITSSSYFTSLAGAEMRKFINEQNLLVSICDLGHFQAFKATTYTAITCLSKAHEKDAVSYAKFDAENLKPIEVATLTKEDYLIDGKYYFSDKKSLSKLRLILQCEKKSDVAVKNGYATLADPVFIHDFSFESKFVIPAIKASCARWTKIFYPYDKDGNLYAESELLKDENVKAYLQDHKDELLDRANEKDSEKYYYAFGRSQAIGDTYKSKLSLNALVKTKGDIKLKDVKAGEGVYGGFYIVSDTISTDKIKRVILTDDFCEYVSLLGKYKSGGYYTYSSKDVAAYLNYELAKGDENENIN